MKTNCEYGPVQNDISADHSDGDYSRSWIPFLRQLLVCTGVWSLHFQMGLCLGTPTVVIPCMREDKGDDYVSPAMASWMYSANNYSSVPWLVILSILASYIGRRYAFGLAVAASLAGFSLLYAGDTPESVLGVMIVQGVLTAGDIIAYVIMTEYTSPRYRGTFLTLSAATFFWGVWVANAIGIVTHWRYIAVVGLACGLYNVVTLCMWPESPYWLARKGKLDHCREAHRWLKGHAASNEKELRESIDSQQDPEGEDLEERREKARHEKWRQIYHDLKSKYVYKSVLIGLALHVHYCLSGKIVFAVYAIDIIKSITKSKSEAYKGLLILDGVTVLGMYIGCALASKMKRRTLLLSSGSISVLFLLSTSIYLYLINFDLFQEVRLLTLFLLIGFSLSVSCGPVILNLSLSAELLPLRLRVTCAAFLQVVHNSISATNLKIAPWIFNTFGMAGAFFVFGFTSGLFLFLFYIYLPETGNKTLKEIEALVVDIGTNKRLQVKT